ncbi:MAG TPA: hypothetical protein VHB48_07215 [Chitinophagaceae bacterium]|nr:hypothetical protein [Chitinophagaceae bacterium]
MKLIFVFTLILASASVNAQTDSVYSETSVDIPPAFPGGPGVWVYFLKKYGLEPVTDSIKNTAVVTFIVDKNTTLPDVRIMNGDQIDKKLIDRLKKALSVMHWMPAILNGQAVTCRTTKLIRLLN